MFRNYYFKALFLAQPKPEPRRKEYLIAADDLDEVESLCDPIIRYDGSVNGFLCQLTDAEVTKIKRKYPNILCEPNLTIKALGLILPSGVNQTVANNAQQVWNILTSTSKLSTSDLAEAIKVLASSTITPPPAPAPAPAPQAPQAPAPAPPKPSWGVDIIDAEKSKTALSGNIDVDVFVIDTGVNKGRVNLVSSRTFVGSSVSDDNGHGTLVAHIIGSNIVQGDMLGVAPGVRIHSYKVLDSKGNGTYSGAIQAINEVIKWKVSNPSKPAVMNLSLGGPASLILDIAVENAVKAGIVVVVAAGNERVDVSKCSPARSPLPIVVGAYGTNNSLSYYSNFGANVDLMAPGDRITAVDKDGKVVSTFTGTSAATPHVSGAVCLLLAKQPKLTPAEVMKTLIDKAKPIVNVGNITNTNRSVYVGDL